MTTFDQTAQNGGESIDMDRVVADPDYRRRVINRLRQDRVRAEEASGGLPFSGTETASHPND